MKIALLIIALSAISCQRPNLDTTIRANYEKFDYQRLMRERMNNINHPELKINTERV